MKNKPEFKASFPITILLNKKQTETLAEALDKILCGYCENGNVLKEIYNNLENALQSENNLEIAMEG